MINISSVVCSDYVLANILTIVKTIVSIIRIVVPILLILGLTLAITKGVLNPEDDKVKKKIGTAIASAVIVFFLPFIINVIMAMISTYGGVGIRENGSNKALNVVTCWANSDTTQNIMDSAEIAGATIKNESDEDDAYVPKGKADASKYLQKKKEAKEKREKQRQQQQQQNNNNNNNSNNNQSYGTYNKVVLIGDSRFYGQSNYKFENSKTTYLAKSGEGYNYLTSIAQQMKSSDSSTTAYVINLGVNDLYNADKYISYINSLATSYQGDIYYLSVNPVEEEKGKQHGYIVSNTAINNFNDKMKSNLKNVTYLDSNAYLKSNGFSTTDGVHYTKETYSTIYNFIASKVKS